MITVKEDGGWRSSVLELKYCKPYAPTDVEKFSFSIVEDLETAKKEDRVEPHKLEVYLTHLEALALVHYITLALSK